MEESPDHGLNGLNQHDGCFSHFATPRTINNNQLSTCNIRGTAQWELCNLGKAAIDPKLWNDNLG
eukprot:4060899-Amphidinium_carterae.1